MPNADDELGGRLVLARADRRVSDARRRRCRLPLFERALKVVEGDTALADLGLLLQVNHAVALGDLDRYDDAIGVARQVRERADDAGSLVRLAQAQTALGELLFEVGRWDDAQAEVESLSDEFKDPGVTCCDRGIAAAIAFHRGDPDTARQHLALAAPSAEKIGNRVVASLTLARSLDHETANVPGLALEVLTAGIANQSEELDEMEDLLPDTARLAARMERPDVAADIAARAAVLARQSDVPHRRAAAVYCRGLVDRDPTLLRDAAEHYGEAASRCWRGPGGSRRRVRASWYLAPARTAFTGADDVSTSSVLGGTWLTCVRTRRHGVRRGPRAKHRQAPTGWSSLTPTETKIARMVAEGLSNRQIAEQLVISTRTVETHVSHILDKLAVRSRVDITRE